MNQQDPPLKPREHRRTWWRCLWAMVVYLWLTGPTVRADFSIVAHRGGFGGPENTVTNAIRAFEAGADIIEIDLRTTADGVLVNLHDATLDRTTTGTGKVNEKTWDEIQAYDAGIKFGASFAGERIPSFIDMLRVAHQHGKKLFLDLKEQNMAEKIHRDLSLMESDGSNMIFVTWGFENELYHDLFPHSEQMQIASGSGKDYNSETLINWRKKGVTGFFFWGNQQSSDSIQHLHAHGMKCGVISGGPADIKSMIDSGLDYFSTDYVASSVANRKPNHWQTWVDQHQWLERPESYFEQERAWWDNTQLPITDYDDDELPLVVEFACGTDAFKNNAPPAQIIRATAQDITIECPVTELGLCETLVSPLVSPDLHQWELAPLIGLERLPNGRCAWKIKRSNQSEVFYKLGFRLR